MSLRAFHIIFITATIILSLYVTLWGIREYSAERNIGALGLSALFLAAAIALMIYGKKVLTKFKELP
jgi:hypothetical protein